LGGHPAEEPYITASRLASVFYFGFFTIILPLTSLLEQIIATEMVTEHRGGPEEKHQEQDLQQPQTLSTEARRQSYYALNQAVQSDLEDRAAHLQKRRYHHGYKKNG